MNKCSELSHLTPEPLIPKVYAESLAVPLGLFVNVLKGKEKKILC